MTDRKAQDISSEEKRQCNSKAAIIATESDGPVSPPGGWQVWIVNKTNNPPPFFMAGYVAIQYRVLFSRASQSMGAREAEAVKVLPPQLDVL
jgi:hypothetical protein